MFAIASVRTTESNPVAWDNASLNYGVLLASERFGEESTLRRYCGPHSDEEETQQSCRNVQRGYDSYRQVELVCDDAKQEPQEKRYHETPHGELVLPARNFKGHEAIFQADGASGGVKFAVKLWNCNVRHLQVGVWNFVMASACGVAGVVGSVAVAAYQVSFNFFLSRHCQFLHQTLRRRKDPRSNKLIRVRFLNSRRKQASENNHNCLTPTKEHKHLIQEENAKIYSGEKSVTSQSISKSQNSSESNEKRELHSYTRNIWKMLGTPRILRKGKQIQKSESLANLWPPHRPSEEENGNLT